MTLTINGVVQDLKMKLGRSGEGYFEEEVIKKKSKYLFVKEGETREKSQSF